MNVEVNIDELVLVRFKYGDRLLIAESVQQELTRLFSERELPTLAKQDTELSRLDGGVVLVAPNSKPSTIGKQVAQQVYKGLSR